jgi:hypothetical protein
MADQKSPWEYVRQFLGGEPSSYPDQQQPAMDQLQQMHQQQPPSSIPVTDPETLNNFLNSFNKNQGNQ